MEGGEASGYQAPEEFFAVEPRTNCPHLHQVAPLPTGGMNIQPCLNCGHDYENWLCLVCYQVYCGRYVKGHMLDHKDQSHHQVALSLCDLSVWCYVCDYYVTHQSLKPILDAAHHAKFGTGIP